MLALLTLTFNLYFCYLLALKAITMPQTIQAVYENGVFRPLQKLDIPERQRLERREGRRMSDRCYFCRGKVVKQIDVIKFDHPVLV